MNGNYSHAAPSRQAVMESARKLFGYTPNLIAEMSNNPVTADGYLRFLFSLRQNGTLTHREQQIVMLAISAWNGCRYCIAAHKTAARRAGVAQSDLDRLGRLEVPADRRLQALATATWALLDKQGRLAREDLAPFADLGIEKAQIYEIVALIAVELIANYVDHFENLPLDAAIVAQRT